jgi:MFS family permease
MQSEGLKLFREYPDFAFAVLVRFTVTLAQQIIQVANGWYIYDVTGSAFALGYLGLAGLIPALSLVVVTGYVADRYPRRLIMLCSDLALLVAACGLLGLVTFGYGTVWPIYIISILVSSARAFNSPAVQAIVPSVLPPEKLPNGVTISSSMFTAGQIIGPALGGILYAIDDKVAYATPIALFAVGAMFAISIKYNASAVSRKEPVSLKTLLAGFQFAWQERIVLGAVSLDTVCVAFGSVTLLLPVFAKDILQIGPEGLGILRSAPAVGGILMAIWLSNNDYVKRDSGTKLFVSVGLFGLVLALFGLSTNVYLSILLLVLSGAVDMVSVVIRHTLVQSETPDELRGRVSSVNAVFITSSTELGNIRAGIFAGLFGAAPAAVIGGLVSIGLSLLWPKLFPELRARDHLVDPVVEMAKAEAKAAKQASA